MNFQTVASWRKEDVASFGAKIRVARSGDFEESRDKVSESKAMADRDSWSGLNQLEHQPIFCLANVERVRLSFVS